MRVFRVGLTIGAFLLGKDPVGPSTVVRFLQTRRRKLRALKYNGLRSIRTRNAEKSDGKIRGILTKIYNLISGLACSTAAIPEDGIKMVVKKSKKNKSEVTFFLSLVLKKKLKISISARGKSRGRERIEKTRCS